MKQAHTQILKEILQKIDNDDFTSALKQVQLYVDESKKIPYEIYYLGIYALFALGQVYQIENWLAKIGKLQKKKKHAEIAYLYITSYLHVRQKDWDQVLLNYTRILQKDPSQTRAHSLIEKMGNEHDEEKLHALAIAQKNLYLSKFLPLDFCRESLYQKQTSKSQYSHVLGTLYQKIRIPIRGILFLAALILIILACFPFLSRLENSINFKDIAQNFSFTYKKYYKYELQDLPQINKYLNVRPAKLYTLKPVFIYKDSNTALDDFRQAREHILNMQVNEARYLLGKLELSNIDFISKERVTSIRNAIPTLRFIPTIKDKLRLSPEEIIQHPYLYRDAQIFWEGQIASHTIEQEEKKLVGTLQFNYKSPKHRNIQNKEKKIAENKERLDSIECRFFFDYSKEKKSLQDKIEKGFFSVGNVAVFGLVYNIIEKEISKKEKDIIEISVIKIRKNEVK